MGQSKRATKCKRSTRRSKSLVFYKYHKSIWLHILLWNSRCHCRSYGKSTHCKCDPLHYCVTFVKKTICKKKYSTSFCSAKKIFKTKKIKNTKKSLNIGKTTKKEGKKICEFNSVC